MEKLLETLAKIEQKANHMIDNAHSYQSDLDHEKEERLKKLELEYQHKLEETISALRTKTKQDITNRKENIQSETKQQLETLNNIKEEDLSRIADRMVADILEGAPL